MKIKKNNGEGNNIKEKEEMWVWGKKKRCFWTVRGKRKEKTNVFYRT